MSRNSGFAAIAAIFILVVLAGLGVVLVSISATQQRSSAADIKGVQAYQTAIAGLEFGSYQVLNTGGLAALNDCTPAIGAAPLASTTSFALNGYTVKVDCSGTSHAEVVTAPPINVYDITVTACNRGACPAAADGDTYIERQLRTTVGTAPP